MAKPKFNVYNDGRVHVCEKLCGTCIYQPQNQGQFNRVIKDAEDADTAVVCHSTLPPYEQQAICRGYWETHKSQLLIHLALLMGVAVFDKRKEDAAKE